MDLRFNGLIFVKGKEQITCVEKKNPLELNPTHIE